MNWVMRVSVGRARTGRFWRAGLAAAVAVLSGCAYTPPARVPPPVQEAETPAAEAQMPGEGPTYETPADEIPPERPAVIIRPGARESSAPAAVASLVEEGWTLFRAGQWQQAIATAERGLRIQRRAAELYLLLARAYLALDNPDQARAFANQGLRYSRDGGVTQELESLLSSL